LAHTTKFNGTPLLNGMGETMEFQVGIDGSKMYDRVFYNPNDTNITPASLGIAGAHISDKSAALENLGQIDKAMDRLSLYRSYLGGMQATLGSNVQNMDNHRIHSSATNSRIRDKDTAYESAKQIQNEIIMNGSGSILAQANNFPQQALKLLDV
jgi:flagellin